MILECPSCQARFRVAEAQIPEAGRTVRCSKCAHAWHVERAALLPDVPVATIREASGISAEAKAEGETFLNQLEAAINAPETQVEHGAEAASAAAPKRVKRVRMRKPINPKPFKLATPALAAVWLVLAFITYYPQWLNAPVLGGIYRTFGISSTEGLVFSDVTMEREHEEGGKTKFILAGSIRNNGSVDRDVPIVRVKLRDAKGGTVWGRSYPVNTQLKAGEVYPFRISNIETMFASSVSVIKVDMGNSLQLMVR